MPNITGNEKVNRLPVIVSQESGSQFLGAPIVADGTGAEVSEGVFNALNEWNADENIVAMSFDTTYANTGHNIGACIRLEQKLNRSLLKPACRYHMFEIFIKAAHISKFGKSEAPTVLLFKRFQDEWKNIDQTSYVPGINNEIVRDSLNAVSDDIIQFCKAQLKEKMPRDDYKELLQLTLRFLGEDGQADFVKFRVPGAISHARFMSKAIYSLKIFMFESQFDLSQEEFVNFRDICIFIVRFYVKAWFQCTNALHAPKHDLEFMKAIHAYAQVDFALSFVILDRFRTHLWYLSEETIALAFFDDEVTFEEKGEMRQTLYEQPESNKNSTVFRLVIPSSGMRNVNEWKLKDFITENTVNFFARYDISVDFMANDPSEWKHDEGYKRAQAMLSKLQVVNDAAERGVKLIKDFTKLLTRDETEKQYLLQVIDDYRKKDKGYNKSQL